MNGLKPEGTQERNEIMANLYQIDQGILECLDLETGEVIDPERLESLQMERELKLEGVACWIKNLLSDADAIKAERDALSDREARCRNKAESLKKWLAEALGGQKFSTAKCAVSFRKSTKLEVLDAGSIPKEFWVETVTVKPDANAIKALLKDGKTVKGCCLIENQNIQIK
jgi:hypothetical protein